MSRIPFCPTSLAAVTALSLFLAALGCLRQPDRLYALALDHEPTEADWDGALPVHLEARGGQTSRPTDSDVDSDAVHTATASCHHGAGAPSVPLTVRAFFDDEKLYLRFEWVDPSVNAGPSWSWDGRRWVAGLRGGLDGLGILWAREPATFSCAHACHLHDWRMSGPRGLADYAMRRPTGEAPLDLWMWRAGRGALSGMAEDASLGPEGVKGDGPGDLFFPNSTRARLGKADAFDGEDTPAEAPLPSPGARAPAYVALPAAPGRLEVRGVAEHRRGGWRLTLSRALRGTESEDVVFSPGQEVAFGVSVFDGVAKDHNAVAAAVRLVLVDRRAAVAAKE